MAFITSIGYQAWALTIWCVTHVARIIVVVFSWILFPQARTHKPNPIALVAWFINNAVLVVWILSLDLRPQLYGSMGLAGLHFLIIVTALLVITEENDVWLGYVRWDRVKGRRDDRSFTRGRVVKSLPLIAFSGLSYLTCSAIAVKAWHSQSPILTTPYDSGIPIVRYVATVAAQVPALETLLEWSGFESLIMQFQGTDGTLIKHAIEISSVSVMIGAINSYFRQRREIRRLVEALGGETGNIQALEYQAARAPEEIKLSILQMALHDATARVRRRAMTVALYANVLTFPSTMIYNLHRESSEANKQYALAVSAKIIDNNVRNLDAAYFEALTGKIKFQLQKQGKHGQRTRDILIELLSRVEQYSFTNRVG